MRRIESIADRERGRVTYEFADGRRFSCDARVVERYGIAEVLRGTGHADLIPTERVPLMQDGQRIGTVPGDFDPVSMKSKSFLYDVRPGDFTRVGDTWVASRMLGPGDLEAVPGFVWERSDG